MVRCGPRGGAGSPVWETRRSLRDARSLSTTHTPATPRLGSGTSRSGAASARSVIVYATFPTRTDAIYWYAVFNGSRWVSHRVTDGGGSISPGTIEYEYAGGIALDHANPSTVYPSIQVRGGWEIQRWTTADGGVHWTRRTVVGADRTDNVRPVVPRGYDGGPMGLLWLRGDYNSYTTYKTSIAFLK
jgi:hypothetical protein